MIDKCEVEVCSVAHLLWGNATHLTKSLSVRILDVFPSHTLYLRGTFDRRRALQIAELNRTWLNKIPRENFAGTLEYSWILSKLKGRLRILASIFVPQFNLRTLWMVFKGPRNWVIHGDNLTLATHVVFFLLGKQLVFVHWGGNVSSYKGKTGIGFLLSKSTYNFYRHIYVLMSPEEKYFHRFVDPGKVSTLPYPGAVSSCPYCPAECSEKILLLGNNAMMMHEYQKTLELIDFSKWESVWCMLAYGASRSNIKEFISYNSKRFGDVFKVWDTVLPLDEYLKRMQLVNVYVCPYAHQAGLGAIYNAIRQGKILILYGDNYKWISSLGIKCINLSEVNQITPDEISKFHLDKHVRDDNAMILNKFFVKNNSRWPIEIMSNFSKENQ